MRLFERLTYRGRRSAVTIGVTPESVVVRGLRPGRHKLRKGDSIEAKVFMPPGTYHVNDPVATILITVTDISFTSPIMGFATIEVKDVHREPHP